MNSYLELAVPSLSLASSRRSSSQVPTKDGTSLRPNMPQTTSTTQFNPYKNPALSLSNSSSSLTRLNIQNNWTFMNTQSNPNIPKSNASNVSISRNPYLSSDDNKNTTTNLRSSSRKDPQPLSVSSARIPNSTGNIGWPIPKPDSNSIFQISQKSIASTNPPASSSSSVPPRHSALPPRPASNYRPSLLLESEESNHMKIQTQVRNQALLREMDIKQSNFQRKLKELMNVVENYQTSLEKFAHDGPRGRDIGMLDLSLRFQQLNDIKNDNLSLHKSFIHELNEALCD